MDDVPKLPVGRAVKDIVTLLIAGVIGCAAIIGAYVLLDKYLPDVHFRSDVLFLAVLFSPFAAGVVVAAVAYRILRRL